MMIYRLRNHVALLRVAAALAISLIILCMVVFAVAQTPAPAALAQEKLTVRQKAKLPDYKGPSRFSGRKALMTFSPDGHLVAMSGAKRTITIWDTETGALKATLTASSEGISGFSFSPDGRLAATRDFLDKSITLWQVGTWQKTATLSGRKRNLETKIKSGMSYEEEFGPVAFSPDGKSVLSEREDDLVALWDVARGEQRFELNHNTTSSVTKEILKGIFLPRSSTPHFLILQTGFSADGRLIFTINGDKSAKIWDAASGELKIDIANKERIYRASFSPNSDRLLTVEQQGGMKLWHVETGQLIGEVAKKNFLEDYMKSFEFSPDGKNIATFLMGDTRLWDVKTGELRFKLLKSQTTDATFSPDGRWLATASSDKQSAGKIWNVETGEVKLTLAPTGNKSVSVIFNPEGTLLVTTNDKGVTLWDAHTGAQLATLEEARYPVTFSPDGRTIATGARNDTAILWELQATH
jgi:WD40 repeat protein